MKTAKIITFAHSKGGTGKSTNALNVAYAMKSSGYRVGIIDMDHNQIVAKHNQLRENSGLVGLDVLTPSGADSIKKFVTKGFDYVIVDMGGYDTNDNRAVMKVSDLVICPLNDTFEDRTGFERFRNIVQENGVKRVMCVFSKIHPQKNNMAAMDDFIAPYKRFHTVVRASSLHSKWHDKGKTVFDSVSGECYPRQAECLSLASEIIEELK